MRPDNMSKAIDSQWNSVRNICFENIIAENKNTQKRYVLLVSKNTVNYNNKNHLFKYIKWKKKQFKQ